MALITLRSDVYGLNMIKREIRCHRLLRMAKMAEDDTSGGEKVKFSHRVSDFD